jgi:hypothetical protein
MNQFSVIALLLLGCSVQAQNDRRILEAIGQAEGWERNQIGDAGKARGRYQMHQPAWVDANIKLASEMHRTYPWRSWKDPVAQDMVAAAYLRVIRDRFQKDGILDPSVEQLALAWNVGYSAAKSLGFRANGYAMRVSNLHRVAK